MSTQRCHWKEPSSGREDDSSGKGAYGQTYNPSLIPCNPHGRGKEQTPTSCALTSVCTPWHVHTP